MGDVAEEEGKEEDKVTWLEERHLRRAGACTHGWEGHPVGGLQSIY